MRFPLPEGGVRDYRVVEERVMAAELQARYPQIRTFTGVALDGIGGTVHFDLTERGFHAMLLTPGEETVYIDPVDRDGGLGRYLAYTRSAFFATTDKVRESCDVHPVPVSGEGQLIRMGLDVRSPSQKSNLRSTPVTSAVPNGSQLRTYRLALACTGEYAQYHGGTTSGALSAMATSLVRINGVYHRDVAIHMELIANNDAIIYLNGSTDPYTNNDGGTMLSQNHTALVKGFMGQTTAFERKNLKPTVLVLGENKINEEARYIHGIKGKGFFTFYGGHDPEDYQHRVGDPKTELELHPTSPGFIVYDLWHGHRLFCVATYALLIFCTTDSHAFLGVEK